MPVVSEEDIYPIVDKVIEYIKSTGVKYVVGPMETTMEGELCYNSRKKIRIINFEMHKDILTNNLMRYRIKITQLK
ncbi:hypothetical protein TKV_c14910 [Thermoanaerobacter kivui]|uniref:Thiamine-binding protein domain-containing protein n=1 Tax=Thermoanaerobacter kivui TaxID=2325 RepID=A0A097AS77_THEKI|nr:hypothetical protein TKV_c14910 [Thermoanaerobacter kivui]